MKKGGGTGAAPPTGQHAGQQDHVKARNRHGRIHNNNILYVCIHISLMLVLVVCSTVILYGREVFS